MDKTDYLMRCFRHTHNKDRENYVILGIWHRLRLAGLKGDLQPITQQYVKRPTAGYALLDLYFPAIKIAVECDEAYHLKNYKSDRQREADIFKAFTECNSWNADKIKSDISDEEAVDAETVDNKELQIARVDAFRSYEEIDKQLDFIVREIKARYEKAGSPAWDSRTATEIVQSKNKIERSDNLIFGTKAEVLAALGVAKPNGELVKGLRRGTYRLRDRKNVDICFPHLSYKAGGWGNVMSEKGNIITESRGTGHSDSEEKTRTTAKRHWLLADKRRKDDNQSMLRVMFAHSKNALGQCGYRFVGVYKFIDSVYELGEEAPTKLIWQKISDEFSLSLRNK